MQPVLWSTYLVFDEQKVAATIDANGKRESWERWQRAGGNTWRGKPGQEAPRVYLVAAARDAKHSSLAIAETKPTKTQFNRLG
jgi:hypothetical protein